MLSEATHKHIDFSLNKLEKLVEKGEEKGHKRWWENNEIWQHYFIIVSQIFAGKRRTRAEALLRRSKAIPSETLAELNKKQRKS